jgi:hypothetical protein
MKNDVSSQQERSSNRSLAIFARRNVFGCAAQLSPPEAQGTAVLSFRHMVVPKKGRGFLALNQKKGCEFCRVLWLS